MRAPYYSKRADLLFSSGAIDDPHNLYHLLRAERPLSQVGESGAFLVANWTLIQEALNREEDFSANLDGVLYRDDKGEPAMFDLSGLGSVSRVIATADKPDHQVHRDLLQPRFISIRIASYEAPIRHWVQSELFPILQQGGGDIMPMLETIPARIVADLLGLPAQDADRFRVWSMMGGDMLAGEISQEGLFALAEESQKMSRYLAEHLSVAEDALINGKPLLSDSPIMAVLAEGIAQKQIDQQQAIGIATVLFGAGGESTAALLGSALLWLAQDKSLAQSLRQKPQLIPRFVEEIIRLEPPFKFHYRAVRRDCELGGYSLRANDTLLLLWPSANRDENMFAQPDKLLLDRKHSKQHMGFGRGAHFCIGAALARLEARIVIEEILSKVNLLELASEYIPQYTKSIFVRRLSYLNMVVE